MFARALIVLLLVLNAGVAAWWALRPVPQPAPILQPDDVPRLQLLSEVPGPSALQTSGIAPSAGAESSGAAEPSSQDASIPGATLPAKTPDAAKPPEPQEATVVVPDAPPPVAAPESLCFSLGPFASIDAANAANARLLPLVRKAAVRTRTATPVRAWRVVMPPLPTPEAARATAERIGAAGFKDYLLMREGDDANAIALGRYSSEETARRRVKALADAGFSARAEPLGGGPSTVWLDVRAAPAFDPAVAQSTTGASRREALDCARIP